jgi:hypothetical protein
MSEYRPATLRIEDIEMMATGPHQMCAAVAQECLKLGQTIADVEQELTDIYATQRRYLNAADSDSDKAYWRTRAAGVLEALNAFRRLARDGVPEGGTK